MSFLARHWFSFFLIGLGVFTLTVGVMNSRRVADSADWPSTSGVVENSHIVTKTRRRSGRTRTYHKPKVQFRYVVAGKLLTNDQFAFADASAARVVKKYPSGTNVSVTFDPDRPEDSFIEAPVETSVPYGMGTTMMLLGTAFLVMPRLLSASAARHA